MKKKRFLFILSVLAWIFTIFAAFATSTLVYYKDVINHQFGVRTTIIKQNSVKTEAAEYYRSDYGEINAENFLRLENDAYEQVKNEAREGAVLLKNDGALPLSSGERNVALFGHASADVVWRTNAAGSREYKNEANRIDLYGALKSKGFSVAEKLYEAYKNSSLKRTSGSGLCEEAPSFYTDELKESLQGYKDAAFIVLAREAGEGIDMNTAETDTDGSTISSLALHADERYLLQTVREAAFKKIILLVNSPYPLELNNLDEYGINACLWIACPGLTGYAGIADLLTGEANPSGRTVETWAKNSLSSPAAANAAGNTPRFSNAKEINKSGIVTDSQFNTNFALVQQENIYVGYKYYETRYADCITDEGNASAFVGSSSGGTWRYEDEINYPFGFGLSYTSFSQEILNVKKVAQDRYEVTVRVKNTGMVAGKCVIQIYTKTPYGDYEKQNGIEKSAVQLVAFDKTPELEPQQEYETKIEVDEYFLASYDENNAKGYILSAGTYYFILADNAHDAVNRVLATRGYTDLKDPEGNAVTFTKDELNARIHQLPELAKIDTETYAYGENGERISNRFDNCDINYWEGNSVKYLSRTDWAGTFPTSAAEVKASGTEMLTLLQGDFYEKPADSPTIGEIKTEQENGISFVMMKDAAYDDEEIWKNFLDQFSIDDLAALTANYFGNGEISSVVLPAIPAGDGCDSIGDRPFSEEYSDGRGVCLYSGLLSATWNKELLASRGKLMANEGIFLGYSEIWTGGGNLRRTPFGGRNGEYYAEDANLVYMMSSVELPEMDKRGVLGGIKHFAGNDQESHREGVNTFFTEQSFRENSLRGFEGVLRKEKCLAVMQSFSRQGVVWTSACAALNIGVLREEWGFRGHVITDATFGNKQGYRSHYATTMIAGTDLYCLDSSNTCAKILAEQIRRNDDGNLLLRLRESAKNTIYALSHTCGANGLTADSSIVKITPTWLILTFVADGVLLALALLALTLYLVEAKKTTPRIPEKKPVYPLVSRIFSATGTALSAVSFILILVYYAKLYSFNALVIVLYAFSVFAEICMTIKPQKYVSALASLFGTAAWSAFLCNTETLGSFADKIQGIVMFGHKEFVPLIIAVAILSLFAVVLCVICAFRETKTYENQ